ncbi:MULTISPECIES: polysaccharide lyase [Niastella]|uniref:Polysaccharide lyase n=1 Tax=Niastella soli TaxID=2821487 RepID=A0ABS3YVX1_9BACT|nr:polysaccharide lyase [Niastella soli]MBO9202079.1 polysaccharide lyase [Niastella soli]
MKTLMHKRGNLLRRNQRVLSVSLLLATLAACQKNIDQKPVGIDSEEQVSTQATSGGNIIWSENADGSSFLTGGLSLSIQYATSYGITQSTTQVFNGTKSARFELRDTDAESHSGTRAEISFPTPTTNNFWYSYALYMPSAQYKDETDDEVITQWHGGGGITPAISLRVTNGHLVMRTPDDARTDLGTIEKDRWHTYVYHIIHSSGSDGLIEIWKDGKQIVSRKGASMYKITGDFHLPNWKMGIYKSDWNGTKTTSTNLRVLYFDDIKYGKATATYNEMLPVGKTTTTPTSPTDGSTTQPTLPTNGLSVSSFTLVNSDTEKDVQTISNGQTISLSALKLAKANIRAITAGTIANVKFELSGKQSKTYTDAAAPFALHGDDGNGNYYYGNWNPPALGTYTLKATPYDSKGVAGTAKTITFTIAK